MLRYGRSGPDGERIEQVESVEFQDPAPMPLASRASAQRDPKTMRIGLDLSPFMVANYSEGRIKSFAITEDSYRVLQIISRICPNTYIISKAQEEVRALSISALLASGVVPGLIPEDRIFFTRARSS